MRVAGSLLAGAWIPLSDGAAMAWRADSGAGLGLGVSLYMGWSDIIPGYEGRRER